MVRANRKVPKAFARQDTNRNTITFVDETAPAKGFRFNGRIVEDFKLSSGTRVHAPEIWARARQALGTLVFDVVLAAPDRDSLGLLIFPPAHSIWPVVRPAQTKPFRSAPASSACNFTWRWGCRRSKALSGRRVPR